MQNPKQTNNTTANKYSHFKYRASGKKMKTIFRIDWKYPDFLYRPKFSHEFQTMVVLERMILTSS